MALTVVVNHHKPHKLNGDLVRFSAAGTFCPVIACYQGTEQPPWIAMCNRHENRSWKLPYTQIAHFYLPENHREIRSWLQPNRSARS